MLLLSMLFCCFVLVIIFMGVFIIGSVLFMFFMDYLLFVKCDVVDVFLSLFVGVSENFISEEVMLIIVERL